MSEPGQPWESGQQTGPQGQQWQEGASGQSGASGQYGAPGEYGGSGQYGLPDQAGRGAVARPAQGSAVSPVNETETRVTGRRVVQYIIDYVITGAVASFLIWVFDRSTGAANAVLLVVGALLSLAWYFWYWVYRPYHANGQTFGMQLLSLRIISKDGSRATMAQLLIRGILLIVDTLVWGLVGLITILLSRYRQRVGDHAAKTLVVRAEVQPVPARREYAGAGQAGYR